MEKPFKSFFFLKKVATMSISMLGCKTLEIVPMRLTGASGMGRFLFMQPTMGSFFRPSRRKKYQFFLQINLANTLRSENPG
jgi:hypothetical protein